MGSQIVVLALVAGAAPKREDDGVIRVIGDGGHSHKTTVDEGVEVGRHLDNECAPGAEGYENDVDEEERLLWTLSQLEYTGLAWM